MSDATYVLYVKNVKNDIFVAYGLRYMQCPNMSIWVRTSGIIDVNMSTSNLRYSASGWRNMTFRVSPFRAYTIRRRSNDQTKPCYFFWPKIASVFNGTSYLLPSSGPAPAQLVWLSFNFTLHSKFTDSQP